MSQRVVHFEIGADDPDRAAKFYQEAFSWEIKKWDGPVNYWLVMTGDEKQPGIDGGIMDRNPAQPVINTIDVESVDQAIKKITAAGGKVVTEKMPVPGVGYMAYCADTEGNIFGMMEEDAAAR